MGDPEAAKPVTAAISESASNVERVAALDIQAHASKLSLVQVRRVSRFRAIDNRTIGHCEREFLPKSQLPTLNPFTGAARPLGRSDSSLGPLMAVPLA
jgi:hypothetical protein